MGIAVAAISFTGCENNFEGANVENKGLELTVVADNLSRTEYDATLQDIKWSAGDKAKVIVKGLAENITATIDGSDSRIASFVYESGKLAAGTVKLQGFAPTATQNMQYDATEASGNRTCATRYGINLPAAQDATTATFDKNADILVADDMEITVSDADVTAGKKTVGNFHFRRMVAITEFTYNVTNSELTASDEKVESVSFEVVSEGKYLAGNMYIQPNMDGAKYVKSDLTEITDLNNVFYGSTSNKVTVNLSDKPALKNGFKAWFVTAPVTLEATDKLVFTVVTDKGTTITKTVNAVGKEVSFLTTQKNTLTVNLNNAVEIEKAEVNTFATATLTNADIVAINKAQAYANAAITITAADGSQWMFKGYRQTATNNYLQLQKYTESTTPYIKLPDVPGEIQSVVLTVGSASQNSASGGGNSRTYYFNDTIGASTAVASGTGDSKITLDVAGKGKSTGYIQVGGGASRVFAITVNYVAGEVPKNPTLTVNAQPATVAAAGGNVTVALTVKDLDEAVTATPSESWITNATVNGSNLTFTVAANDVEQERTATITLTSGDLTATVNVKQEAKAAENPGGGSESSVKWVKVTSASDITAGGEYVLAAKHTSGTYAYIPNAAVTSSGVTLKSSTVLSGTEIDDSNVSADMKWTLVASGSGFKIQSSASSSNILYTNSGTGNNVRISNGSTRNEWTFTVDNSYGWKISNGTHRLAVYSATSLRNYGASTTTNQNGTFIIFKKSN